MADTTAPRIIVALWCMVGASSALLSLRFYYKYRYGKRCGWDDIIVAFSWVSSVLFLHVVFCILFQAGLLIEPGPGLPPGLLCLDHGLMQFWHWPTLVAD